MAQSNTPASKFQLFFYGCVGAAAPDIIQLYSKRWTMPGVHFNLTQYLIVSAVYIALGGVLGLVLSRRNAPAALAIGVGTPVVVGLLANFAKSTTGVMRGEPSNIGSLSDLFMFP
ncbi:MULTISPECIES: hypothetical protein [unclassified Janthinobacterium]|uniref:hypothetical protein n=1 Tax=unclassified Janthinobacterium TaxID=2610881 RepID=UPI001113463E|nr:MULTISPECIES: hypothetical protein [unclassified Janthinobacterium]